MIAVENKILEVIKNHKSGNPVGITSVCSSNLYVIKAAIINAKKNNQIALIESTSNQVDQFGGYTGNTPAQFSKLVFDMAESLSFPNENLILGGDHLGPNRWQNENSESAMKKAKEQISAYVNAGYTKIHLDASMKCADDGSEQTPLSPPIIAERSVMLCKAAEETFEKSNRNSNQPVYIIGTDVPPPGGAKNNHDEIHITSAKEAEETIEITKREFENNNLQDAWKRVIAVVVQPGVEFGDSNVFDYDRKKSKNLKELIEKKENLVYEAHSTDYQRKDSLKKMVEDHFAILKVGPWLTFAFREAVFALSKIEEELFCYKKYHLSNLFTVIEKEMLANRKYWVKYYYGSNEEISYARKYSYSDRIRYYLVNNYNVNNSFKILLNNLTVHSIPMTLISQYLPEEYDAIRNEKINNNPKEIIYHKIMKILEIYYVATNG